MDLWDIFRNGSRNQRSRHGIRRNAASRPTTRRPRFEPLENRMLLSVVTIDADDTGGNGTDNGQADIFTLTRNGDDLEIRIDGNLSTSVSMDGLVQVVINGSDDDDTVIVNDLSTFSGEITVNGGAGADKVTAQKNDGVADVITTEQTDDTVEVTINGTTVDYELSNVEVLEVDDDWGADTITSTYNVDVTTDVADLDTSTTNDNRLVRAGADGVISLRAAVAAANRADGAAVINLDAQEYDLSISKFTVTDTVSILGVDADSTVIDASGLGAQSNAGIFYLNDTDSDTLTLQRMTLTGGNSTLCGGVARVNEANKLVIEDAILSGNQAVNSGGAVYGYDNAEVTIKNSTISGNSAKNGGGVALFGVGNTGKLTITNSTISGNTATRDGGGIQVQNHQTAEITNSTISGNVADGSVAAGYGGGLRTAYTGETTVTHSTFAYNEAKLKGGGIFRNGTGTVTLGHTIVAGNTAATQNPDLHGAYVSNDYNLIGDVGSATGLTGTGDQTGASGSEIDPFGANELADNGGPTWTIALNTGSAAIDAGDSSITGEPTYGQRGADFVRKNWTIDIGAYELQFADPDLLEAVRRAVGLDAEDILTTAHLAQLTSLSADSNLISSLQGLELAVNLQSLALTPGDFSTTSSLSGATPLSPLAELTYLESLTLQGFGLDDTDIANLGGTGAFAAIESLDLRYNDIDTVSTAIAGLPALTSLLVYGNPLTDAPRTGLANLAGKLIDIDLRPDGPEKAATVEELADALYNLPIKMYEYVLNTIEYQPYAGSMKGPIAVVQTGAGNDWDTAQLLAELFTEAGVSTSDIRYVTGEIHVPAETIMDYTGTVDLTAAGNVIASAGLNATFRGQAPHL